MLAITSGHWFVSISKLAIAEIIPQIARLTRTFFSCFKSTSVVDFTICYPNKASSTVILRYIVERLIKLQNHASAKECAELTNLLFKGAMMLYIVWIGL